MEFIPYDPPWTAFQGKYHLWKWRWGAFGRFMRGLRRAHFDLAVSVRTDPRDHLLMYAAGAVDRVGFPSHGSGGFLTRQVDRRPHQHKVEDWRALGRALGLAGMEEASPSLNPVAYPTDTLALPDRASGRPLVVLHPGARIAVRRWPEEYFREVIRRLRTQMPFDLAVVVEPDGYGAALASEAQAVFKELKIGELVALMGRADLLFCNDSGPGHIAAACGTPSCVIFGPGDPDAFRPWGSHHFIGVRDLCKFRPCFDYCRFPEPYCLTRLTPDEIWGDMQAHLNGLITEGRLTSGR